MDVHSHPAFQWEPVGYKYFILVIYGISFYLILLVSAINIGINKYIILLFSLLFLHLIFTSLRFWLFYSFGQKTKIHIQNFKEHFPSDKLDGLIYTQLKMHRIRNLAIGSIIYQLNQYKKENDPSARIILQYHTSSPLLSIMISKNSIQYLNEIESTIQDIWAIQMVDDIS